FRVGSALLDADGAECGVIELLGCGDIVGADENMREHGVPPPVPGRPGSRARGSLINVRPAPGKHYATVLRCAFGLVQSTFPWRAPSIYRSASTLRHLICCSSC